MTAGARRERHRGARGESENRRRTRCDRFARLPVAPRVEIDARRAAGARLRASRTSARAEGQRTMKLRIWRHGDAHSQCSAYGRGVGCTVRRPGRCRGTARRQRVQLDPDAAPRQRGQRRLRGHRARSWVTGRHDDVGTDNAQVVLRDGDVRRARRSVPTTPGTQHPNATSRGGTAHRARARDRRDHTGAAAGAERDATAGDAHVDSAARSRSCRPRDRRRDHDAHGTATGSHRAAPRAHDRDAAGRHGAPRRVDRHDPTARGLGRAGDGTGGRSSADTGRPACGRAPAEHSHGPGGRPPRTPRGNTPRGDAGSGARTPGRDAEGTTRARRRRQRPRDRDRREPHGPPRPPARDRARSG